MYRPLKAPLILITAEGLNITTLILEEGVLEIY